MNQGPTKSGPLRLLGCLVKGPLGCFAFLMGALVVFVIFLPPTCGNIVSQEMETWFAEHHQGTLTVEKAWLGSLYGEQKIKGVSLRAPDGSEIFRAVVVAPSLEAFISDQGNSWGPIRIEVPVLNLIEYADRTSNLERALARRAGADAIPTELPVNTRGDSVSVGPFAYDSNVGEVALSILIGRVSWTTHDGSVLEVNHLECHGRFRATDGRMELELTGRGVFTEGVPDGLVFDLDFASVERWAEPGVFLPWNLNVELEQAPVLALEVLAKREGQLGQALGAVIERCSLLLVGSSPDLCRVESFELTAPGAVVSLAGDWHRQERLLTAQGDDWIRIGFPVDSWWTREVVGTLLPLMDDVRLVSASQRANLVLEEFAIPLDGSLWGMSAHCTVEAESAVYLLPETIASELLRERKGERAAPFEVDLDGGLAAFATFPVSTEKGELEVRGELNLRTREYDLQVKTKDGKEYRVQGERASPRITKP